MEMKVKYNSDSVEIETPDLFSADKIFDCGQCFRFEPEGDGYSGIAFGRRIHIREKGGIIIIDGANKDDFESVWFDFFDFGNDYRKINDSILSAVPEKADFLQQCEKVGAGIRILRQDPWETLVSFIISQNNNIPRIKKLISALCIECGERIYGKTAVGTGACCGEAGLKTAVGTGACCGGTGLKTAAHGGKTGLETAARGEETGSETAVGTGRSREKTEFEMVPGGNTGKQEGTRRCVGYAFPSPEAVLELGEKRLAEMKFGFRAGYIADAAKKVCSGEIVLSELYEMSFDEAFAELCSIRGVGAKVASCVLLFAYHKLNAFPIDVWIQKVIDKYFDGCVPDFGEFAGIAQQYLFYRERYTPSE